MINMSVPACSGRAVSQFRRVLAYPGENILKAMASVSWCKRGWYHISEWGNNQSRANMWDEMPRGLMSFALEHSGGCRDMNHIVPSRQHDKRFLPECAIKAIPQHRMATLVVGKTCIIVQNGPALPSVAHVIGRHFSSIGQRKEISPAILWYKNERLFWDT